MSISPADKTLRSMLGACPGRRAGAAQTWWSQYGEASLNWLALGLLLAAWNTSDDDAAKQAQGRPAALRGYSSVSVRAAQRAATPAP